MLVFFSVRRNSESSVRFRSLALSPLSSALTSKPLLTVFTVPLVPIIRSSTGFMVEGVALVTCADSLNCFSGMLVTFFWFGVSGLREFLNGVFRLLPSWFLALHKLRC